MKNELGIKICGENCKGDVIPNYDCPKCGQKKCGDENCQYFAPKEKLLKQRIRELQEQQFTWDELNLIRNIIIEVKRVHHPRYYGFHPTPLLNKIERILNNE